MLMLMSAVEAGQVSVAETGQMSAAETRHIDVEVSDNPSGPKASKMKRNGSRMVARS